jgi:hypothetical protein
MKYLLLLILSFSFNSFGKKINKVNEMQSYLKQIQNGLDGQLVKVSKDQIFKECKIKKSTCSIQKANFFVELMKYISNEAKVSLALIHFLTQEKQDQFKSDLDLGFADKFYTTNKYYTLGIPSKCRQTDQKITKYLGKNDASQISKIESLGCENKNLVAYAVADLDGDQQFDVWKIDFKQNITHLESDYEQFDQILKLTQK